jgi:hypothetical protein
MSPQIDLLGCEYLGGCPSVGSRVLNKVELHFDDEGLTIAIAPQGLFTLAAARPVLALPWSEITVLSATKTQNSLMAISPRRLLRLALNLSTMRLDLPDRLAIGTRAWTMTVGVRVPADELADDLRDLVASRNGPSPAITAG